MEMIPITFAPLSSLVPEEWRDWFYGGVSDNAPVSFCDNDLTLVTARRLHAHCEAVLDAETLGLPEAMITEFLKLLESLQDAYVDLES